MSVLLVHGSPAHSFCGEFSRYLSAQRWPDLVEAVRTSPLNCSTAELCTFCHEDEAPSPLPRVQNIVYKTKTDLLEKIGFYNNPIPLTSDLNPQVKGFVPTAPFRRIDPKREAAARCFQKYWRLCQARVGRTLGNHYFMEGQININKFDCPEETRRKYRCYYLGPLPHMIYYLESARNSAKQEKTKLQKKVDEMVPDDALVLMEKISELACVVLILTLWPTLTRSSVS